MVQKILIVGSRSAALCAGIAALEKRADVKILMKTDIQNGAMLTTSPSEKAIFSRSK